MNRLTRKQVPDSKSLLKLVAWTSLVMYQSMNLGRLKSSHFTACEMWKKMKDKKIRKLQFKVSFYFSN